MNNIIYRQLALGELADTLLDGFVRHQEVTGVFRKNGRARGEGWDELACVYTEDWNESDRRGIYLSLIELLRDGGVLIAAYDAKTLRLTGFAAVENKLFGAGCQYVSLDMIYVSEPVRGSGIGKGLFRRSAQAARQLGGKKLYISAHPSAGTQAFCRAVGCVEAAEYDAAHVEAAPYNCQLEYDLYPQRVQPEPRLSIDEYQAMAGDIVDSLPDEFFYKLNGGVIVRPELKIHPQSLSGAPMYIMGEYTRSGMMGQEILLYYGSFVRNYGSLTRERQREELRRIIVHEFRHHLEWLSGTRDLEIEDEKGLLEYMRKHMKY